MSCWSSVAFVIALSCAAPLEGQLERGRESGGEVGDLVERGRALCQARDWASALEVLSAAVGEDPHNVEALRWRGHAFTGSERYPEALADLTAAYDLDPDDAWTCYARAMALHKIGQLEQAVRFYTEALVNNEAFYKAHEWRGYTLSLLGDQIGALSDLDIAVAYDASNADLLVIRAKVLVALGALDRAEKDLRKANDVSAGDDPSVTAQLGYLQACMGNEAAAEELLARARGQDPKGLAEASGWIYWLQRRAGVDVRAGDMLAASDAAPTTWLKSLFRYLGGDERGAGLLTAAGKDKGLQCEAWLHIGLRAESGGDPEFARRAFASCIAVAPTGKWESLFAMRLLQEMPMMRIDESR